MAELYKSTLSDPNVSTFGGSVVAPPTDYGNKRELVKDIGSLAIEAFKGYERAEAKHDFESLELQTQAAQETLITTGNMDKSLSMFSDKIRKLDAGMYQGSLTPQEYKIKRETLLKEYTKNVPGMAADFKQIYQNTATDRVDINFQAIQQMQKAQAARADAEEKAILANFKLFGLDERAYFSSDPQVKQTVMYQYDQMLEMHRKAKAFEMISSLDKANRESLAVVQRANTNAYITSVHNNATKSVFDKATGVLGIDFSGATDDAGRIDLLMEGLQRATPEQRLRMKAQLQTALDQSIPIFRNNLSNVWTDNAKVTTAVNDFRGSMEAFIKLVDNKDYADLVKQQLESRRALAALNFEATVPGITEMGILRNAFGDAFALGDIPTVEGVKEKGFGYVDKLKNGAGSLTQFQPNAHTYANSIDPKTFSTEVKKFSNGLAKVTPENLKDKTVKNAITQSINNFSNISPDAVAKMSLHDIDAMLELYANPNMYEIIKDNPQAINKLATLTEGMFLQRLNETVDSKFKQYITPQTRLLEGTDQIVFTGPNADKLNKLAVTLNNASKTVQLFSYRTQLGAYDIQGSFRAATEATINSIKNPPPAPAPGKQAAATPKEEPKTFFGTVFDNLGTAGLFVAGAAVTMAGGATGVKMIKNAAEAAKAGKIAGIEKRAAQTAAEKAASVPTFKRMGAGDIASHAENFATLITRNKSIPEAYKLEASLLNRQVSPKQFIKDMDAIVQKAGDDPYIKWWEQIKNDEDAFDDFYMEIQGQFSDTIKPKRK